MIYYNADENKKIIIFTKSAKSAADYNLTNTCENDGLERAYNGAWYVKGYAPKEPEEHAKAREILELKAQLSELDEKSARSMRAILANTATEDDRNFLANLEMQAENLRKQIKDLQGAKK